MIIDAKVILDPFSSPSNLRSPLSPSSTQIRPTLSSLPAHILLQIIHHTFPPLPSSNSPSGAWTSSPPSFAQIQHQLYQPTIPERQRKTLLWLSNYLRLVSRTLYTACMHVLRSTYLPAYLELVRPPYTSDPFPIGLPTTADSTVGSRYRGNTMQNAGPPAYSAAPTPEQPSSASSIRSVSTTATRSTPHHHRSNSHSPLISPHRETVVLDRFILLKVQQDVYLDDTELHTDRADAYRDIFDVAQPKARLEDLVRVCGFREGVVSVPGWNNDVIDMGGSGNLRLMQSDVTLIDVGTSDNDQAQQSQPTNWAKGVINFDGTTDSSSNSSSSASLPLFSPTSSVVRPQSSVSYVSANTHFTAPTETSSSSSVMRHPLLPAENAASSAKSRTFRSLFFRSTPKKKITSSTYHSSPPPSPPPPEPQPAQITPLPFASLSISFSPRRVGLVYNRTKTIAEVARTPGQRGGPAAESLEYLAYALVDKLKSVLLEGSGRF